MTSQFSDANIAVLGLGKSGLASSEVLTTLGAKVWAYDSNEVTAQDAGKILGSKAQVFSGTKESLVADLAQKNPSLIVISPGIAPSNELYRAAVDTGATLISEIELAWKLQLEGPRPNAKWLCVTGTNGKTTTVQLATQMLITGGVVAAAGGNVGTPAVQIAAEAAVDAMVVELSSFQLHNTRSIEPWSSICLNVAPDHLDWHGDFKNYMSDKAKVYENTRFAAIYPEADKRCLRMVEQADVIEGCRAIGITMGFPTVSQLGVIEDILVDRAFLENRAKQSLELATFADLDHLCAGNPTAALVTDVLAAAALTRAYGLQPQWVRRGILEFEMAAHRRSILATIDDVTWIDDSKATNSHAARASLLPVDDGKAIWIFGGDPKGQQFEDLVEQVKTRLKAVIVIGRDQEPFMQALSQLDDSVSVHQIIGSQDLMKRVVAQAKALALPGDQVVLAPGCASWDQFTSYAQRGNDFLKALDLD